MVVCRDSSVIATRTEPSLISGIDVNNREGKPGMGSPDIWELRIYVAGKTPRSLSALSNLKRICEQHLKTRYRLQVIDVLEAPELASADQIIAIPTVLRRLPLPQKKIA